MNELKRVQQNVNQLSNATNTQSGLMARAFTATSGAIRTVGREIFSLRGAIVGLGLTAFVRSIFNVQVSVDKMTRFFQIATGSVSAARQELEFTRQEAERLGLPFAALAETYGKFAVAANTANFSTSQTREIFSATSEALTVMNANAEDTRLVFLALEQMVSKGTVSMEELRRQLGERIPGAFQLAARSMGVTTAQLDKMVSSGQVTAQQLLPALAREFRKTFGPEVPAAARDAQSQVARLQNAIHELRQTIGDSGFMKTFTDVVVRLTTALKDPSVESNLGKIVNHFGELAETILRHPLAWATLTGVLTGIATALAGPVGALAVAGLGLVSAELVKLATAAEKTLTPLEKLEELEENISKLQEKMGTMGGRTGLGLALDELRGMKAQADALRQQLFAPNLDVTFGQSAGRGIGLAERAGLGPTNVMRELRQRLNLNLTDESQQLKEISEAQFKIVEGLQNQIQQQQLSKALDEERFEDARRIEAAMLAQESAAEGITAQTAGLREQYLNAKFEILEQARAMRELQERARELADINERIAAGRRATIQEDLDNRRQLIEAQAELLEIEGRSSEANKVQLQGEIKLLKEKIDLVNQGSLIGNANVLDAQKRVLEERLRSIGRVTVNLGEAIANSVSDAFSAVVSGTRSLADVGKGILAGLQRSFAGFLTDVLKKKLGFENILLDNTKGFGKVISNALTSAVSFITNVASKAASSIGELFGATNQAASSANQVSQASSTTANAVSAVGGSTPWGKIAAAVIAAIPNFIQSWTPGSGIGQRGGVALDLIGLGGLFQGFSKSIGGQPQTKIQSLIQNQVSSFIDPFQGIIVQAIINAVTGIPDPRVRINAKLGLAIDTLTGRISFDQILLDALKQKDIEKSRATDISNQVIAVLQQTAAEFTDILGIFPRFIVQQVIPAIEESNRALGELFARTAFSERGPLTIAEELERFTNKQARAGFFFGTRGTLGAAAAESILGAGLSEGLATQVQELLPSVPEGVDLDVRQTKFKKLLRKAGGLQIPRKGRDVPAFIEALQAFAGITGGLANAGPVLTEIDRSVVERQLGSVVGITSGEQFTGAIGRVAERLNPILGFIQAAAAESENLISRAIAAAFEAASESVAQQDFLNTIGDGVRQSLFNGIQQAFIESAQFSDLLAPVQQAIRAYTQGVIAGEPVSISDFRAAVLPAVEEIGVRAGEFAKLAPEIQKLRESIDKSLEEAGLTTLVGSSGGDVKKVDVTLTTANVDAVARKLFDLLGSRTPVS